MSKDLVFYQDLLSDIKCRIRLLQVNVSILPMPLAKLETVIRKPSVSLLSKEPISPQAVAKLKETAIGKQPVSQFKKYSILPPAVAKLENDTISPMSLAKIVNHTIENIQVLACNLKESI